MSKNSLHSLPLVTIITAVFNGEKHIEQSINSVLNQTYKNIEYIVIDGGSTDSTLAIIKKYENKITYWISEPDNGLYEAINKGLKLANGAIIGILSSTDYYFKNSIQLVVDSMLQNKEVDILHGEMLIVDISNTVKVHPDITQMHYKQSIFHPTCFVKKEVYKKIGLFNTSYKIAADYDFLLKCLENKIKFFCLEDQITAYRAGGMSTSCKSDWECYHIQKKHKIPNPYKYIFRGLKCVMKQMLIKKRLVVD